MTSRRHDDRGIVAGAEILPAAVVVFVIGSLLLTNLWTVVDAKLRAATAAREAGRAYIETTDPTLAPTAARATAADVLGPTRAAEAVVVAPEPAPGRCAPVTVTVTLTVPLLRLPLTGGGLGTTTVTASHTERQEPWRSGPPGDAGCA